MNKIGSGYVRCGHLKTWNLIHGYVKRPSGRAHATQGRQAGESAPVCSWTDVRANLTLLVSPELSRAGSCAPLEALSNDMWVDGSTQ